MSVDAILLLAGLGSALAGFVRGYSGFGSGMILVPVLTLLYDPQFAVVSVVMLELIASAQMLPGVFGQCHWRSVIPMSLSSVVAVPLGTLLLVNLDAETMRQGIALVLLASVLIIASRSRSKVKHSNNRTAALITGASSGVISGATSLGGPPVILYYLSGNLSVSVTRASIVVFLVATALVTLMTYITHEIVTKEVLQFTAWLAPIFIISIFLGKRLFGKTSEAVFRAGTLMLLGSVGLFMLFL